MIWRNIFCEREYLHILFFYTVSRKQHEILLPPFWSQQIRDINFFTKELYSRLIWRKKICVAVNFLFFYTYTHLILNPANMLFNFQIHFSLKQMGWFAQNQFLCNVWKLRMWSPFFKVFKFLNDTGAEITWVK